MATDGDGRRTSTPINVASATTDAVATRDGAVRQQRKVRRQLVPVTRPGLMRQTVAKAAESRAAVFDVPEPAGRGGEGWTTSDGLLLDSWEDVPSAGGC